MGCLNLSLEWTELKHSKLAIHVILRHNLTNNFRKNALPLNRTHLLSQSTHKVRLLITTCLIQFPMLLSVITNQCRCIIIHIWATVRLFDECTHRPFIEISLTVMVRLQNRIRLLYIKYCNTTFIMLRIGSLTLYTCGLAN